MVIGDGDSKKVILQPNIAGGQTRIDGIIASDGKSIYCDRSGGDGQGVQVIVELGCKTISVRSRPPVD